ncbi:ferrochelatase [Piscinibacterium candidicorallinum]|jgi:ferrochelatase|uniref:Ferrochelatase n=1 Tax=Piscinibacterium candidicorallinum TaxID=1793872 RepID=A0ABV7H097_9BURK
MKFNPPAGYKHGQAPRIGVLLVQLGTPDEPTAPALRRYLAQFLSDPRVVEIPRLVWLPILHGIILNVRPAKSARKYASIWMNDGPDKGSPLRVYSEKQAKLLRGYLGDAGIDAEVALAMRYGNPSVESVLNSLLEKNVDRLLVVPMYPQYSATTTASVIDEVNRALFKVRNMPELRFVKHWHDNPAYIDALVASVRRHFEREGVPEKLVMSFHGVPKRTLLLGDPYHCECYKTARLVAERLGWPRDKLVVSFQSRFGKAEWLKPYTQETLVELAKSGTEHVAVMCPAFVSDCLETLEEINDEVRHEFLAAGGKRFDYIPCLNDSDPWIHALTGIVRSHMQGWGDGKADLAQLKTTASEAQRVGASNISEKAA